MNKKQKFPLLNGNILLIWIVAAITVSLIVTIVTGDDSVWTYMIPLGVAMGAALSNKQKNQPMEDA